jgi:hypothetical protein
MPSKKLPAEQNKAAGPTQKTNQINDLAQYLPISVPAPEEASQAQLFHIEKQVEYDGIEMGVLENGVPYLSEVGVSRMCGVDRKVINRLAINWSEEKTKDRGSAINELLIQAGYTEATLFIKSELKGVVVNAYTEPVCLALLEYYAFVAKEKREEAVNAFRKLAKISFRKFIYDAVGYHPDRAILDSWKHFHDRIDMTLDAVPNGFFSVFREIASMIVPMIRSGVFISDKVVPDISVGIHWSRHWEAENLMQKFGDRVKYSHSYPEYYPQSKSNPQPAFAYPDLSLGYFRAWLKQNYISTKFPQYLINQVKDGKLAIAVASKVSESLTSVALPAPAKKAAKKVASKKG